MLGGANADEDAIGAAFDGLAGSAMTGLGKIIPALRAVVPIKMLTLRRRRQNFREFTIAALVLFPVPLVAIAVLTDSLKSIQRQNR